MFCGKDDSFGKLTREHFVPRCLWDKGPSQIITVPAHGECNRQYSADNEYFRDTLVTSEDCQNHPQVQAILAGPVRRKIQKRRGSFYNNFKNVVLRPQFTPSGIFTGLAPMHDVDWPRVETVLKNVMKGVFFWGMEHPMPQNMELEIGHIRGDTDMEYLKPAVDKLCEWNGFGDDVFLARYIFHSQDKYMHCLMQFYRSETFYGQGVIR